MSKLFFDHLIVREELNVDLDLHQLDATTRSELLQLIDEILNHHALNVVLSHLPKKHHPDFISRLIHDPGDPELLGYLKSKVTVDIESEIKKHLLKIKTEIKSEIKKAS